MKAEIRQLSEAMKVLAVAMNKENNNPNKSQEKNDNPNKSQEKTNRERRVFPYLRSMGGYCHSCGFHPIRVGHTSNTCKKKKDGHSKDATWNNQMDGSTVCPNKEDVAPKQQNKETYKGKLAPTN